MPSSNGSEVSKTLPTGSPEANYRLNYQSSNLPFGQAIPFGSIGGPTYLNSQTLVQHVAYILSDRIWTYSPETFDLDVAVQGWFIEGAKNARGYTTKVQQMQIRQGAASIALGYIFSKDFDNQKRPIPQSILAPAATLIYLRDALDQLSLLYAMASPVVVHIAAVDYAVGSSAGLVTDYVSSMALAEELGLGLVSSFSVYEVHHMSLFATLLANFMPTIHTYDGISMGRESVQIVDSFDQVGLNRTYEAIQHQIGVTEKRKLSLDMELLRLLEAFNGEMGTTYGLYEYHGHVSPTAVLVVFGSIESSLASQVARSLEANGVRAGVINVRVYRPFVEEEFLKHIPNSVQVLGILGQVYNESNVLDSSVHSNLYEDVLAAVTFSENWQSNPKVIDLKYPRQQVWSPISMFAAFQTVLEKTKLPSDGPSTMAQDFSSLKLIDPLNVQQYTFWDVDESPSALTPIALGQALSKDPASNVTVKTKHDNLLQGGAFRTDIRKSKKTIEAGYSIEAADVIFVGAETLLKLVDVLVSLRTGGTIIIRLPGIKIDELESKLPETFRKALYEKEALLYILNPLAIEVVAHDSKLEPYLTEIAFLRIGLPELEGFSIQRLATIHGGSEVLEHLAKTVESALSRIDIPETWSAEATGKSELNLMTDIHANGFIGFEQLEDEASSLLKDWKIVAKGLAFKEAYGAKLGLRPDLSMKTYTVHVQENRRLTPLTYDRNIFHIEFDIGDSGLKYDIGEALGIHAENDEMEVQEFIQFYGLDAEEIVEVANRDNPNVLENRTVYQALMQNVDIFGRPPKRFYEALAEFADNPNERKELLTLGGSEGAGEFKRRAEVDTTTYADILLEFSSAHPNFHDIIRIVNPMKRREYSIASCQKVTPTSIALMIVVVGWVDPKGRDRFGQATRFLNKLGVGVAVTVSVKPSVMKLPPSSTQPLIMAGLGTGLAPFRAFVQHRALEKEQGKEIGAVLLYMGSRHQREEYCYGEEWEAYQDAGVITLLGRAFSRDQPQKIYIQDRMRESMNDIIQAYLKEHGAFYLCGPTWPVPDVTNVLEDAIAREAKTVGRRTDPKREIERLKDQARYVLEVY